MAAQFIADKHNGDVQQFHRDHDELPLTSKLLAKITKDYSLDVATLYFLIRNYNIPKNQSAQDQFNLYFQKILAGEPIDQLDNLKEYFIAFVPGFGYIDDTTTGADFARQRALIDQAGIGNKLIQIGEYDLVDQNAFIVTEELTKLCSVHPKILIVSASKGGLETAIALGRHMDPNIMGPLKAWLSVGGLLRGSPLADFHLVPPKSWMARFILWTKGKNMDMIHDLSYDRRSREFEQLDFPKHLQMLHYVAAPLATKIHKEIRSRHRSMIKGFGPNDGLTPLADEITENGIVVSELGLNHYFRDSEIDKKTFAMALVALDLINARN